MNKVSLELKTQLGSGVNTIIIIFVIVLVIIGFGLALYYSVFKNNNDESIQATPTYTQNNNVGVATYTQNNSGVTPTYTQNNSGVTPTPSFMEMELSNYEPTEQEYIDACGDDYSTGSFGMTGDVDVVVWWCLETWLENYRALCPKMARTTF